MSFSVLSRRTITLFVACAAKLICCCCKTDLLLLLQVAVDECSHFCSLAERLEAIGSFYGALPAHDG
jgi:hypothetical protein